MFDAPVLEAPAQENTYELTEEQRDIIREKAQLFWLSQQFRTPKKRFIGPRSQKFPATDTTQATEMHPLLLPYPVMKKFALNANYAIEALVEDLKAYISNNPGSYADQESDIDNLKLLNADEVASWREILKKKGLKSNDNWANVAETLVQNLKIDVNDATTAERAKLENIKHQITNISTPEDLTAAIAAINAAENSDAADLMVRVHHGWRIFTLGINPQLEGNPESANIIAREMVNAEDIFAQDLELDKTEQGQINAVDKLAKSYYDRTSKLLADQNIASEQTFNLISTSLESLDYIVKKFGDRLSSDALSRLKSVEGQYAYDFKADANPKMIDALLFMLNNLDKDLSN